MTQVILTDAQRDAFNSTMHGDNVPDSQFSLQHVLQVGSDKYYDLATINFIFLLSESTKNTHEATILAAPQGAATQQVTQTYWFNWSGGVGGGGWMMGHGLQSCLVQPYIMPGNGQIVTLTTSQFSANNSWCRFNIQRNDINDNRVAFNPTFEPTGANRSARAQMHDVRGNNWQLSMGDQLIVSVAQGIGVGSDPQNPGLGITVVFEELVTSQPLFFDLV